MSIVAESTEEKIKLDNPFSEPHKNDDVVIMVEDIKLYLHSVVLNLCSPVFEAMLSENFVEGKSKEISLPGKRLDVVVEMLKYFYPHYKQTVHASTNFKELLALCQEYDLSWLNFQMEKYLLSCQHNDKQVVYYLALAVKYELKELQTKLESFKFNDCFSCVKSYDGFECLHKDLKVMLLKKRLEIVISNSSSSCTSRHSYGYFSKDIEKAGILNFISEIAK